MNNIENIPLDQGYYFGMGVFETIAVEKGTPLFLQWHLERMKKGLDTLEISKERVLKEVTTRDIEEYLKKNYMEHGVLKIMVSERNILFSIRENPYVEEDYNKGFRLGVSEVIRNETSVFTYIKSFHYGDNLLEKRKIKKLGYDETLFFNTKNHVTETSASNIFFVKKGKLYTPKIECGLLDGIVRRYVLTYYDVEETSIKKEEIEQYDEAFLTNSLMGMMPVTSIGEKKFESRKYSSIMQRHYREYCFHNFCSTV